MRLMRRSTLSRNHYFIIGIFIGLALSLYLPEDVWDLVQQEECPQEIAENNLIEKFGQDFEPHLNLISKPLAAKKPAKNVIRPRYYSSELGIREKVFIGVMTSQENINTLATAINRTTAHLVNKIKFFINADNVKTNYKLKNIVGFTDTRESLRPFHVIKYIADNYLDDYDYFLIMPDTVYVDGRKLNEMLYHISITFDLYMGVRVRREDDVAPAGAAENSRWNTMQDMGSESERNYCDLNGGILLSSSVIRKMRNNLDWCVRNIVTNVHSVNIGRCVKYSSNLAGCQGSFQGVHQGIYTLQSHIKIFKDLNILARDEAFRNATLVHAVTSVDDFYRLHAYYSKYHLELIQKQSADLERKAYRIANGTISNNILEIRWPLGVPLGAAPETRHDIINWHLINGTHLFLPNAESIVEPLSHIDQLDFDNVLAVAIAYAKRKHPHLQYVNLHTVYRKFDATRGMDYQFHLNMRDTHRSSLSALSSSSNELLTKSFQIFKPLGRVEVIPSPYVTESTRIAILVPTFEHQLDDGINFVLDYERICMQNQDNTFLLMIFLYRYDSMSKGENDPFKSLKNLALDLSTKYKNDGSRIAWVSIRLPLALSDLPAPENIMLNSIYDHKEILSVAVADLALPKIGLDSLVLMASTDITFKADFLNRVRMNTIQGFQIYSPIGFMMYPCRLAYFCKECESCDVSQSTGYFDKWNYDLISFYSRDYVQARKMVEVILPITRTDNDIEQLIKRTDQTITTILDMFVISKLPVHILRATEPNLRYGNAIRNHINNGGKLLKCPALQQNGDNNYNTLYNEIPQRYEALRPEESDRRRKTATTTSNTNGGDGSDSWSRRKCIHLASRKQIGDAIIRYEDRSILHK